MPSSNGFPRSFGRASQVTRDNSEYRDGRASTIFNSCHRRGKEARHSFQVVKNHDSTGKELESVGDERVGENEGCEEKKSCTAAAEKFAFHPFQRWRGPFIRSANQFESARSATLAFLLGKSMKRRGNPLQSSPRVSNWPLFIALRINNFPSACVPLLPFVPAILRQE